MTAIVSSYESQQQRDPSALNPNAGGEASGIGPLVTKPWGAFQRLEGGAGYQVKRLDIAPGQRISYQTHAFRSEHWYIVAGVGGATIAGREFAVGVGQSVDVAIGVAHRITNTGDSMLIVIEVQRGTYLGEDDIVRLSDDFGRASVNAA